MALREMYILKVLPRMEDHGIEHDNRQVLGFQANSFFSFIGGQALPFIRYGYKIYEYNFTLH